MGKLPADAMYAASDGSYPHGDTGDTAAAAIGLVTPRPVGMGCRLERASHEAGVGKPPANPPPALGTPLRRPSLPATASALGSAPLTGDGPVDADAR